MANSEERHVLNVRVMLGGIGYNVMHVVVAFPPTARQATKKIGNEDADAAINVKVVRNAHVAGIMHRENELVP